MKLHTKQLTLAALTAAAYAVLSYFGSIFGITYGPIQCRFSEALCVLPFFLPETAWGLGVGCCGGWTRAMPYSTICRTDE